MSSPHLPQKVVEVNLSNSASSLPPNHVKTRLVWQAGATTVEVICVTGGEFSWDRLAKDRVALLAF
jgi:hypothetical protein